MKTYFCPKCGHEFCMKCAKATLGEKGSGREKPLMKCHSCKMMNDGEHWRAVPVRSPSPRKSDLVHPDLFVDHDTRM
jgi:NMD protein affecting ribosome stability and mRNA decay